MKTRSTGSAFTLAELLIVIVIIGILMALLLPAVLKGTISSKIAVTKAKMSGIAMAVDAFQRDFGFYPPTVRAYNPATGKCDGDLYDKYGYNEALVQCLCNRYTKGTGDPLDTVKYPSGASIHGVNKILGGAPVTTAAPYLDVKASDLVDKDNDGFQELVDSFGNPFIYIPKDDYFQADGTTYNAGAVPWVDTNSNGIADLGEYAIPPQHYQRFKFQLISLGPDGKTPLLAAPYEYIDAVRRPEALGPPAVLPWRVGTDDDLVTADKNRAKGFTGDDINNWGQ